MPCYLERCFHRTRCRRPAGQQECFGRVLGCLWKRHLRQKMGGRPPGKRMACPNPKSQECDATTTLIEAKLCRPNHDRQTLDSRMVAMHQGSFLWGNDQRTVGWGTGGWGTGASSLVRRRHLLLRSRKTLPNASSLHLASWPCHFCPSSVWLTLGVLDSDLWRTFPSFPVSLASLPWSVPTTTQVIER